MKKKVRKAEAAPAEPKATRKPSAKVGGPSAAEDPVGSDELAIWAANVALPLPQTKSDAASRASKARRWTPAEEHRRMGAMKSLRSKLVRLTTEHCGAWAPKPNVLTFERWIARFALRAAGAEEPLIPADGLVDEAFAKDLQRVMAPEAATAVAAALAKDGQRAATRLAGALPGNGAQTGAEIRDAVKRIRALAVKARKGDLDAMAKLGERAGDLRVMARNAVLAARSSGDAAESGPTLDVYVDGTRQRGTMDVYLGNLKPYLSISNAHYAKMWRLFLRHSGSPKDERGFHEALFCCLARYEALKGAGYQCAVPGKAFEAVRGKLGHTIECFASPLNCHYDRFCSAFGALEAKFGSLGSFFDFDPQEGSFEANPPFVPEVMDAMLERIEMLLGDDSRGPLSFLVVVPAWGAGVATCRQMENSRYSRANVRIDASSHGFCDGGQHLDSVRDRHRPSSWDTAVTLMQNEAGAAQWPVSVADLEATFVKGMRKAVEGGPTLDEWENRGRWKGGSQKRKWGYEGG